MPLAAAIIVLFGVNRLSGIIGPLFLALVLTICVHPLKAKLQRRGIPPVAATALLVLTIYGILVGLVAAIWVSLVQFVALVPQFEPQLTALRADVRQMMLSLGVGSDQIALVVQALDFNALIGAAYTVVGGVLNIGSGLLLLLLLLYFMGIDAMYFPRILSVVGRNRPHLVDALGQFARLTRGFMGMTCVFGFIVAVLNGILLTIVGVPGAFLWALLSFVTGFIPFIGYWISMVPAAVMALLAGGWPALIVVLVFYSVINTAIQSILQPRFVGNSVNLNMTLTFLSVVFWTTVLGILGSLLAIPLTLLVRAFLVDAFPSSHWLQPVLGDVRQAREMEKADYSRSKARRRAAKAGIPIGPGSPDGP